MYQFGDERKMIFGNHRERVIQILDAISEAHDFCDWFIMNPGATNDYGPCIVSDKFSNEIGFCLKTTLPFLSSAIEDVTLTRSDLAVKRELNFKCALDVEGD